MKALLLVGSPRLEKSASETLGAYLLGRLEAAGVETEKAYIHKAIQTEEGASELLAAAAQADVVVLASPLYAGEPPAPVIQLMETMARRLDEQARVPGQRLLAISNCGLPEPSENDPALAVTERFASEAGFQWAGGLALGAGEALKKNQPLENGGAMVRNVVKALDLAADALARGEAVPQKAVDLMRKPLMPAAMYRLVGNLGWRRQARALGTQQMLRQQVWPAR